MMTEVLRAYRVTLDPTPAQERVLASHAGASRWAFNLALGAKVQSRKVWLGRVQGVDAAARQQVKLAVPNGRLIDKARVRVRGTDPSGAPRSPDWAAARRIYVDNGIDPEVADAVLSDWAQRCDPAVGIQPWAADVPNSVIQRAERDADTAWGNWMASVRGLRAGARIGFPRFKSRGKSRDSFYLTNLECRVASYRRVRLGWMLGEVRTHDSLKRVSRAVERSGVIQSVTVVRGGHRWYASILVKEDVALPGPTRRQRAAGPVGISVGIEDQRVLLSTGEEIGNPFVGRAHERRIVAAQRALERTGWSAGENGRRAPSSGRVRARRRLGRLNHQLAARRLMHTHHITRMLTGRFAEIVIEDLDVAGLTRSARGRRGAPGRAVKVKARVNRAILDVEPGELRRQLGYKAGWYGSVLTVVGRRDRSDCAIHGRAKAKLGPEMCSCGLVADPAIASVLVAKATTSVASGRGETKNACGAVDVGSSGVGVSMQEGPRGSPPGSDARASP